MEIFSLLQAAGVLTFFQGLLQFLLGLLSGSLGGAA